MSRTPREVAAHRVGLVDAHAPVEVMTGLHDARCPVGEPVRGDSQVVSGRIAGVEAAGDFVRGQRERPGRDVDVRDLLGHRLELRQGTSELTPVADVARGQVTGPLTTPAPQAARPAMA